MKTYTHKNGNTYNVEIKGNSVILTDVKGISCNLYNTLENFSKLVNIDEYTPKMRTVLHFVRTSTGKKQCAGEASNQMFSFRKERIHMNGSTFLVVKGINNGSLFAIKLDENGRYSIKNHFEIYPVMYVAKNNPFGMKEGYALHMNRRKSQIWVEECKVVKIEA